MNDKVSNSDLGNAMSDMADTNATLGTALHDVADSMHATAADVRGLREEMEAYREAFESVDRKTTRAMVAGVLVAVVLIISAGTAMIVSRSNAAVIESIQDCTSPPGACYEANQRRSNERLGPIISVICEGVPADRRRPPCPPAK